MRHGSARRWLRAGALCLAALHFLVSTELGFAALDGLVPMAKTAAAADFPCAGHDCCCKTAEECATHCCCFGRGGRTGDAAAQESGASARASRADARREAPGKVVIRLSSAARCKGHGPDSARHAPSKLRYVVFAPAPAPPLREVEAPPHRPYADDPPPAPALEDPGKIPIVERAAA